MSSLDVLQMAYRPEIFSPTKDDWKLAFTQTDRELKMVAGSKSYLISINIRAEIGQTLLEKNEQLEKQLKEYEDTVSNILELLFQITELQIQIGEREQEKWVIEAKLRSLDSIMPKMFRESSCTKTQMLHDFECKQEEDAEK